MPSSAASQDFVPIRDVRNNVAILKNGKMISILMGSSINFALKSVDEQKAILSQFQSFLNTLDFSVQFYIQSRRLDIDPYIAQLKTRENNQDNDLMKIQLREYIAFIKTFTTEVDVMSKSFFIVVPYTPLQVDFKKNIKAFLGKRDLALEQNRVEEHLMQLQQRVALVEQGLNSVGVRTIRLKDTELVELFYHLFNPQEVKSAPPKMS